jgi:hypothetical protein
VPEPFRERISPASRASTAGARFTSAPPRKAQRRSLGNGSAEPPAAAFSGSGGFEPASVQTWTSRRASRLKGLPSFEFRSEMVQAIEVLPGRGLLAAFGVSGTWKTTPSPVIRIRGLPVSKASWLSRNRSVFPGAARAPSTRTSRSGVGPWLASITAPVRVPGTSLTIRGRRSSQAWRTGMVSGSAAASSPSGWSRARV